MAKPKLSLNVMIASAEVVVNGVVLFFLYKFLFEHVSIAMIGVWSLVMATTAFGSLAGFGFPRSLVHFLPVLLRKGQERTAVLYIETAYLSIGFFITLLCLLLYYPLKALLGSVIVTPDELALAHALLPWTCVSMFLVSTSDVLVSSIKGLQLNFLSSLIVMVCNLVYFGLAVWLVPDHGIMGMAWAQIAQGVLTELLAFFVLKRNLKRLPYLPRRLSRKTFRKIAAYGFKAQYIAFVVMFIQPLTKYLLGFYSTLDMVGYYEYAFKFVQNVSKMITNANNALTSTFSLFKGKDQASLQKLYAKANSITWLVAPLLMGGLLSVTPVISRLWIGDYQEPLFVFSVIQGLAYALSVMCSPSYSLGMGAGHLRGNVHGQTVIALSNIVLGLLGGYYFGAYGVAAGSGLALVLGNLFIITHNSRHILGAPPCTARLGFSTLLVLVGMWAGIAINHYAYTQYLHALPTGRLFLAEALIYGAVMLIPVLLHPGFHALWGTFRRKKQNA